MYKPNELKEEYSGIYKRFPKLSTYVKNLKNWSVDYTDERSRLDRCASGEDFYFSYMSEETAKKMGVDYRLWRYDYFSMSGDLSRYATRRYVDSFISCFDGTPQWELTFREAAAYDYWSLKIRLIGNEIALDQYKSGEREQKLSSDLRNSGITLGICMALGWLDYARDLRDRISFALDQDMLYDGYDSFGRRRTQHFLIRLLNSVDDIEDVQLKKNIRCAYDLPLFNEILARWKTDSAEEIHNLLYRLCDRHTHQCRQDSFNGNRYYDFENIPLEYYLPVEILCIFKLRTDKGLKNPIINHPIMNTPLARLTNSSKPYSSDFLTSLLGFIRKEGIDI